MAISSTTAAPTWTSTYFSASSGSWQYRLYYKEISTDKANNTSRIQYALGIYRTTQYIWGLSFSAYAWFNNTPVSGSNSFSGKVYFSSNYPWAQLTSGTIDVVHNADGTGTCKIDGQLNNNDGEGSPSSIGKFTGGTITLTPIPRDPVLKLKKDGAWKQGKPWVKIGGVWKKAVKAWVKVGGVWKETPLKG